MAASFISNHRYDVGYWHLADNPTARAFVRFWSKADIGGVLGRNRLSANDPYRPFTLPYIIASARDNRDARKEAVN